MLFYRINKTRESQRAWYLDVTDEAFVPVSSGNTKLNKYVKACLLLKSENDSPRKYSSTDSDNEGNFS